MKIHKYDSKVWDLLIIIPRDITFGLVRQCNDDAHGAWMTLFDKYKVSEEKQERLNEVTNRSNT